MSRNESGFLDDAYDQTQFLAGYGYPDANPSLQSEINALIQTAQSASTTLYGQENHYYAYVNFERFRASARVALDRIINDRLLQRYRNDLITKARNLRSRI